LTRFEVLTLAMRNKITKCPVSHKAPVAQEAMQSKNTNAAMSSVPNNVLEVEHGEDVCQESNIIVVKTLSYGMLQD